MAEHVELLWGVLLFAAPLLTAALGELVLERAGIVNIGIEGMMLAGALGGWIGNSLGGVGAGLAASIAASVILGLVFALVVLGFNADAIVAGAGVNLLSLGLTGLLARRLEGAISGSSVRLLHPGYLIAAMPVLVAVIWAGLRYTRLGLEVRAVGESPEAASAAGVPVRQRRLMAVLFAAGCAGIAGGYLSTMRFSGFSENMTEGTGFLALAMVIFGRWSAAGVMLSALLFGLARAWAYQAALRGGYGPAAVQAFNMLPYVLGLLALAGLAGRSQSPGALGRAMEEGG